ncbi:MAG: type 1 glutamine amidotransferase [Bacteroidia bacterium]
MSKLKIHYIQHVPYEGIGCIDYWAQAKGHILTSTKIYEETKVYPPLESFDWLIVMGGPMSVNEPEKNPWMAEEKKFIHEAIKKNKVVIGICLGSQIVASVLGAKVSPNEKKEIGWFDVKLTDAAQQHDAFNMFPESFKTFHWHGETFDLPRHATLLMSSQACKHQAFIHGKRTIGLQFHLEATQAGIKDMIENHKHELGSDDFVQTEEQIMEQSNLVTENHERMRLWLNKLSDIL